MANPPKHINRTLDKLSVDVSLGCPSLPLPLPLPLPLKLSTVPFSLLSELVIVFRLPSGTIGSC
jgi:hypothetical protein